VLVIEPVVFILINAGMVTKYSMQFDRVLITTHLDKLDADSIFLEIGSSRGPGCSTQELADIAYELGVKLHSVDIRPEIHSEIKHDNVVLHTAVGSEWCESVLPTLGKKIAFLYLDNFDIIWDILMLQDTYETSEWNRSVYDDLKGPSWPEDFTPWHLLPNDLKQEIRDTFHKQGSELGVFLRLQEQITFYKQRMGVELTNNNCQIEHLTQLMRIEPFLARNSVVMFDDTFTVNDCWHGKCGPGVVFLQCNGFQITSKMPNSVLLTRSG
jgi:hypothetical protein